MTPLRQHLELVVARAVASVAGQPGPLLIVLHGIQDELGYIPRDAVPMIATRLNLSRADVHGVISFYHYFREEPPGRHTMYLCRAEACQSMGGRALEAHALQALGVDLHGSTADEMITLEPVYCLGNCALSPCLMVDRHLYGRVTPRRFDAIVDEWRAKP